MINDAAVQPARRDYLNEESVRRAAARTLSESCGDMLLLDETHLIPDGDEACFARIIVTVESWPWLYPTDLGRRIADVIRAECATAKASDAPGSTHFRPGHDAHLRIMPGQPAPPGWGICGSE